MDNRLIDVVSGTQHTQFYYDSGGTLVRKVDPRGTMARLAVVGWKSVGLHDQRPCLVRDLWAHLDLGVHTSNYTATVARHDVALLKLTQVK